MICVLCGSRVQVLLLSPQVFASVNILRFFYLDLSNYDLFVVVSGRLMYKVSCRKQTMITIWNVSCCHQSPYAVKLNG